MSNRVQIRGDSNNPYHLSVGGVLLKKGKIFLIKKSSGDLTLPRETPYSDETIHVTLMRGFVEELGIDVTVSRFLGSLKTYFNRPDGTNIEKTTLYFLVYYSNKSMKNQADEEVGDEVIELELQEAILNLKEQKNDEFIILQRI